MTHLTLKVPDPLAEAIEWYAKKRKLSRSRAMRQAILAAIVVNKPPKRLMARLQRPEMDSED